MAHTNVTIPNKYSTEYHLRGQCEKAHFERDQAIKERDFYYALLGNIPEAIEQYGYVDINFENKTTRLIKKTENV
jgi:hypothetical protein